MGEFIVSKRLRYDVNASGFRPFAIVESFSESLYQLFRAARQRYFSLGKRFPTLKTILRYRRDSVIELLNIEDATKERQRALLAELRKWRHYLLKPPRVKRISSKPQPLIGWEGYRNLTRSRNSGERGPRPRREPRREPNS